MCSRFEGDVFVVGVEEQKKTHKNVPIVFYFFIFFTKEKKDIPGTESHLFEFHHYK